MTANRKQPITPFWLIGWACALAIGWLLPVHYLPWSTFHVDAWLAVALSLASLAVIWRTNGPVVWHGITLLVALLALLPGLQYAFGQVLLSGTAWISSAYLIGFLLALLTGARWESASPGQLADGLFLAVGTAALLSVGLQLHQWLALDVFNAWSMGDGYGRPFANFGQPNQLASFLVWGLLSTAWGLLRRHIGLGTALLLACYLLFGLALTQSRTAWVAVAFLVFASWFWRSLWTDQRGPWLVTGLGLCFAACVVSLGWLTRALQLSTSVDMGDIVRISAETRPAIWSIFVDAALQHPLVGYGWGQIGLAQATAALGHPPTGALFTQSHNLFLDLVLWCGIPVGLLASLYLVRWFWFGVRAVSRAEDAVLILFLLVIGNHAMLELPLQYAYFLLPVGLVMGVLDVRLKAHPILVMERWSVLLVWSISVLLLALIIRDYARVETSYQELRFEWAHIKTASPGKPPDVLLLTQFREFIRMSRFEPVSGTSADDLDRLRKVTGTYPGSATISKLALALALNQQAAEAQLWINRMCRMEPESRCNAARKAWMIQSVNHPELAAVRWTNSASAATEP